MNYALWKKGLIYNHFLYCDTSSYDADRIFVQNNVTGIKFGEELRHPDYAGYCIIFVKIPKWKTKLFIESMSSLERLLCLYSHKYLEICEKLKKSIEAYKKESAS